MLFILKERFPEQYQYIKTKVDEKDEEGNRKFFLGFRDNALNLYYKSMAVAVITYDSDNNCVNYSNDPFYLENTGLRSPLSFDDFKKEKIFNSILGQIEKHVYGKHGEQKKHQREKDCQQWIITANNMHSDKWFFLDLEYVYQPNPCGRFDMIAISREKNANQKHDIALVELKIRHSQYGGIDRNEYADNIDKYNKAKLDIFNPEVRNLKYGSGIVSHLADFLRFLNDRDDAYIHEELLNMIQGNVDLELIDKNSTLGKIKSIDEMEDIPLTYILTYTYVPYHTGDKAKAEKISSSKRSFYNFIYSKGTPFGLCKMLKDTQIDGLTANEKEFRTFINEDEKTQLIRYQNVNDISYKFIFEFIDPDKNSEKMWECLRTVE